MQLSLLLIVYHPAINYDSAPYVRYGQFSVLIYLIEQSILMTAQFKQMKRLNCGFESCLRLESLCTILSQLIILAQ
jgi:hypothetical protein